MWLVDSKRKNVASGEELWLVESRRQNVAWRGEWRVKERLWLVERRRREELVERRTKGKSEKVGGR